MFQIGDRVLLRRTEKRNHSREGTVIGINGKWITIRHDSGDPKKTGRMAVPPRFDYLADDLQHENPLLRIVDET